jgi:ankyrin repeat protein
LSSRDLVGEPVGARFIDACLAGDALSVRAALAADADPNRSRSKKLPDSAPLDAAFSVSSTPAAMLAVIRELLAAGANPNARNTLGRTAVHSAVYWERPDVLKLLLDHGGDPNAVDSYGLTPLGIATKATLRKR